MTIARGDKSRTWLWRSLLLSFVLTMAGCGPGGCGSELPADVSVTGTGPEDPTTQGTQSETAASVSNFNAKKIITVTYNDDTDPADRIGYTPGGRIIKAGATMLGWSYSKDFGKTWRYGGTVAPPPGWPVLWGDPAITTDYADQRYVFISNLAIPSSKMPADGISGGVETNIGGACIARSDNGGVSFAVQQCITNNFDFYDGGSMAAAGMDSDRRIFAAFVDLNTNQIDVWASPTDTGTFQRLPNPYPGMKMVSHPHLRFSRASRSLYVGALAEDGKVYLNRYRGGSWGSPVFASGGTAGNPTFQFYDRKLRTAPQFSFDVGAPSQNGNDEVRILYTVRDERLGKLYVRGTFCDEQLTACHDAPEWGTTPGNFQLKGHQFNPTVRAFPGFIGLPPVWKATYMSVGEDGATPVAPVVSIKEGNLAVLPNGTRSFLPFDLVKGQLICPDNRGYWGDYNELQFAGFESDSSAASFILPHSDSSKGCSTRWEYTSQELHVSAVVFK